MKLRSLTTYGGSVFVLSSGLILLLSGCGGEGGPIGAGNPPGYTAANGITGGKSYDKFWAAETGWNQADPNLAIFNAKPDFFRCKQCHGWDRLGRIGSYISRGPNANRPRVADLDLAALAAASTPQELFDGLKRSIGRRAINANLATYDPATNPTVGDQMPDIGSIFTDAQIWNLVKFLKAEALDTSRLYDSATVGTYPTGTIAFSNIGKDGNAANGDLLFAANCSGCHGADGRAILVDGSYHVGNFVRAKPNEGQHKLKFGQLGSSMGAQVTSLNAVKDLYRALTNAAKYPD